MPEYRFSTAQKMKFSIKDFFCKCDQIRSFLHSDLIRKNTGQRKPVSSYILLGRVSEKFLKILNKTQSLEHLSDHLWPPVSTVAFTMFQIYFQKCFTLIN